MSGEDNIEVIGTMLSYKLIIEIYIWIDIRIFFRCNTVTSVSILILFWCSVLIIYCKNWLLVPTRRFVYLFWENNHLNIPDQSIFKYIWITKTNELSKLLLAKNFIIGRICEYYTDSIFFFRPLPLKLHPYISRWEIWK